MRVLNKHKGNVVGIEPGAVGEVDENNDGIKVFLSAGLLVDADTHREPEREPTLEEAKKAVEELASRLADAREFIQSANDRAASLERRIAELEAQAKASADESASKLEGTARLAAQLAKDIADRDARIAELEAQLALKSEPTPAPADAPAPEAAPVKKGKG